MSIHESRLVNFSLKNRKLKRIIILLSFDNEIHFHCSTDFSATFSSRFYIMRI